MKKLSAKEMREIEHKTLCEKVDVFYRENPPILELAESNYDIKGNIPLMLGLDIGQGNSRYDDLTENQKISYSKYFSSEMSGVGCVSYLGVRYNEILLGLIYNYPRIDLSVIEKEILFLKHNVSVSKDKLSLLEYFFNFLKSSDKEDRSKRLLYLRMLDYKVIPTGPTVIVVNLDEDYSYNENPKMRVNLETRYIDFAMKDPDHLLRFKDSKHTLNCSHKRHDRDLVRWETFEGSKLACSKYDIEDEASAKKKIRIFSSYIDKSLILYSKMDICSSSVIKLHNDFDILTCAFINECDYLNAIFWCEKFLEYAKDRNEYDILITRDRILKRLNSCKEEAEKIKGMAPSNYSSE
ncbi:MAG: hypothetical protein Q7U04_08545 [Bacteriovorax sp.]|nr:hypothetical protein [Bacteriovorax sp.]